VVRFKIFFEFGHNNDKAYKGYLLAYRNKIIEKRGVKTIATLYLKRSSATLKVVEKQEILVKTIIRREALIIFSTK